MSESFKAQQGMLTNKHTQFAAPFQFEFSLNTLAWSQKKAGCYNLIKMTSAHFLEGSTQTGKHHANLIPYRIFF